MIEPSPALNGGECGAEKVGTLLGESFRGLLGAADVFARGGVVHY
ncbi:MAG: hypothetical protein P4L50_00290 [Anaerolineaceae bacterium]|nr:hypothetical protein [Anaerolineaceae bacterium]